MGAVTTDPAFAWIAFRSDLGDGIITLLPNSHRTGMLVPRGKCDDAREVIGYELYVGAHLETQFLWCRLDDARMKAERLIRARYPEWFRDQEAAAS